MAEAATTRPARTRAASGTRTTTEKSNTTNAKPAAKPAAKAEATSEVTNVTRFKVELEHAGTTKNYEKFEMPKSYAGTTVGSIYAPLGTARVVVLVIAADDTEE